MKVGKDEEKKKPHFDNVPEFPRLYTFSMS